MKQTSTSGMARFLALGACAGILAASPSLAAPTDAEAASRLRVQAIEGLAGGDETGLRQFAEQHLAPAFRADRPQAELLALLARIGKIVGAAGDIRVSEADGAVRLALRSADSGDVEANADVVFSLEPTAPFRIVALALDTDVAADTDGRPGRLPPVGWDNLEAWLEARAGEGFSGTVLVARGGSIVLHRGYGMANRQAAVANGTDTLFDIGSTPIDFTRAAILLLEQDGKLSLDDPITRFLPEVPADKRGITLAHLMSGRSGLPNFHHVVGVDADHDLSWIDRDTAIERMLGQRLLFAPGQGQAHSHSAFVMLAAIIELVSGQTYDGFLRQRLFEPAAMAHTTSYGRDPRFKDQDYAVGYGSSQIPPLNMPPNWGPTSWLIMGSGGMVSTPGDLYRWQRALESGVILAAPALAKYSRVSIGVGGSDRGFLSVFTLGSRDKAFIASNAHDRDDLPLDVGRALADLALGERERH